jgi:adenylate cyclase class 2
MPVAYHLVAMFEVEIKERASVEPLEAELKRRGAVFEKTVTQADVYYNAPHRDFAVTDEAVRLRKQGDRTFLTYKGKKLDAKSKTRKEVEVEVSDFARMQDILLSLGFRKTLDVVKERRIYHYKGAEVCLDCIEGLGEFVELELQAENQIDIARKRDELIALMHELGVEGELIRESYLEMLLAKNNA